MSLFGGDGGLQVVPPRCRVVAPGRCRLHGQGAAGRIASALQGALPGGCRAYRLGPAGRIARALLVAPHGACRCSARFVAPGRPCGTSAGAQPAESLRCSPLPPSSSTFSAHLLCNGPIQTGVAAQDGASAVDDGLAMVWPAASRQLARTRRPSFGVGLGITTSVRS